MRATACLTIGAVDVIAEIDFYVVYKGFVGSHEEAPEAPEFGCDELTLYRDQPLAPANKNREELLCPFWLRSAIFESDAAFEAMCEAYREERR